MVRIKINLYGVLRRISGEKTVDTDIEIPDLKTAVEKLVDKYGSELADRIYDENGHVRRFINMYVNGRDIRFLSNLSTLLEDGDTISIIPAVGGG